MKSKIIIKIIIDFFMMVALLALMAYSLIGEVAHEWIGAGMFFLFIAHIVMNRKWWYDIIKGKYTPVRIIQTLVNLLIFAGMIIQMVSGIMMSRYVFTFLPINGGASYARTLHLVWSYWSFVLMSVHLGFHGKMLMGIAKRITRIKKPSRIRVLVLRIMALSFSAYGIYAFIQRELGFYMLFQNQFVFFDFSEPIALFFIDYIMIAGLFVCVGHYIIQILTVLQKQLTQI